ncbi:MAG: hypothetical protein E7347_01530 [Clostridiales bacterium]|nr:hypothetical protein [Clostridiales bacterium]
MVYFVIIFLSMALISVFGIILVAPIIKFSAIKIVLTVVILTIIEILINAFFATVIRRCLPKKWFSTDRKVFIAKKTERKFYEKIGIKRWKDKVLELGVFTNFHKNKIAKPNDNEYIERYILEANYGVLIHAIMLPLSFLILIFGNLKLGLFFTLPIAIVSVFLNLLPLFILRYNLPKLHALYRMNKVKNEKSKNLP